MNDCVGMHHRDGVADGMIYRIDLHVPSYLYTNVMYRKSHLCSSCPILLRLQEIYTAYSIFTTGMPLEEFKALMKGPSGSEIELEVEHAIAIGASPGVPTVWHA